MPVNRCLAQYVILYSLMHVQRRLRHTCISTQYSTSTLLPLTCSVGCTTRTLFLHHPKFTRNKKLLSKCDQPSLPLVYSVPLRLNHHQISHCQSPPSTTFRSYHQIPVLCNRPCCRKSPSFKFTRTPSSIHPPPPSLPPPSSSPAFCTTPD